MWVKRKIKMIQNSNDHECLLDPINHRYRNTNQICVCAEWNRKYSAILKLRKRHTNQWGGWLTEVDFFIFLGYFWVDFNQIKSNIFLKDYTFYVYTMRNFKVFQIFLIFDKWQSVENFVWFLRRKFNRIILREIYYQFLRFQNL